MLPFRALNMVLGSLTASLVYLIGREHFDRRVGLYAALFVSLFPGLVIWNLLNLYETMAVFLFVAALYVYPKNLFFSGFLMALASQSRTEFWIITFAICLSPLFYERKEKVDKFIPLIAGWLVVMIPFCYFYQATTEVHNPIYPLYYGLFGGFGFNLAEALPGAGQIFLHPWRPFWILLLSCSVVSIVYMMKRTPKKWFVYIFLVGILAFHSIQWFMSPASAFHPGFSFLTSKYFMGDFAIGSLVITKFLSHEKIKRLHLNKIFIVSSLVLLVFTVPEIQVKQAEFSSAREAVELTMKYYDGGTIACDSVLMNYLFANEPWNVPAENIIGNFYTPILGYGIYDITELELWFERHNVTLWLRTGAKGSDKVFDFIQAEKPSLLVLLDSYNSIGIYKVSYDE